VSSFTSTIRHHFCLFRCAPLVLLIIYSTKPHADTQSDVEDLLPPLASRANLRSIEDEERDLVQNQLLSGQTTGQAQAPREVPQTSSPSALSSGIPTGGTPSFSSPSLLTGSEDTPPTTSTETRSWCRRLDEISWVKKAGLAESGTGNVLVWGAPNVDNIGRLGDRVDSGRGKAARGL
jgi:cytochrome c oxidase assembly factor 3